LLSLKKRTCGLFVAYLAVVPTNRITCQDDDKTKSLIAMQVILVCYGLSRDSGFKAWVKGVVGTLAISLTRKLRAR